MAHAARTTRRIVCALSTLCVILALWSHAAAAADSSESKTSGGLTVYLGIVPAKSSKTLHLIWQNVRCMDAFHVVRTSTTLSPHYSILRLAFASLMPPSRPRFLVWACQAAVRSSNGWKSLAAQRTAHFSICPAATCTP